jgi:hypothetical protein
MTQPRPQALVYATLEDNCPKPSESTIDLARRFARRIAQSI